jgi:hypothetical protein
VDRFRAGDTWVLVATDLMARGMDFVGVSTVGLYKFLIFSHFFGRNILFVAHHFFRACTAVRARPVTTKLSSSYH